MWFIMETNNLWHSHCLATAIQVATAFSRQRGNKVRLTYLTLQELKGSGIKYNGRIL
jgi:hypothetical protein